MRKLVAFAAAGALALTLTACGQSGGATTSAPTGGEVKKGTIGVLMPTKTSERWIKDGDYLKQTLEADGYTVELQYANDDIPTQVTQLSSMVTKQVQMLVVASIDGVALKGGLKEAKEAGIPVIAYDRLLRETDAVSYYATFDNFKVGVLQGSSLIEGLEASGAPKPWNVELFAGSPDDNNATFFFKGAMSVLQPKIDDGTLKVLSGQTSFEQAVTQGWKAENAQRRADTLLTGSYSSESLDGVLSPNDTLARAVLTSVKAAGKELPVVTGQDSEVESVKSIMAGEQYSTINKDTRKLVEHAITMVKDIQAGKTPEINDDKSYNNTVKTVPAYLLDPVIVTQENVKTAYVDDPVLGPITK